MVGAKLSALGLGLEQIKTVDVLMYLCRGVRVLWSSSLAFRWGGSFVLFLCFWRCFFASGKSAILLELGATVLYNSIVLV